MSDSTWQSLHYLNLLWLLVPTALLFLYARKRRASLLKRFAHIPQIATLASSVNVKARTTRAILILLAAALVIVALARPAWNKSSQPFKAQGRDVVFILDISRSMLANHRNTTRLEEAKFAIQECLATVKGDRVALIIFAGQAKIACPLTHDYAYFLARLNDVDYRSVTFGGTMLGDAIRLACNGIFKGKSHLYRDVIVITDGEDMQSNPIQSAEQLAELNARLIAVGLGDSTPTPLVITLPDGSTEEITEDGKPVMTKLDAETLQAMTEVTIGGIFIPVPSDTMLTLNDIYREHVQKQLKRDFESHSVVTYEEKFQLFLAIALILLAIARFLPDKRSAISTVAACILLTCLPIHAKSPDKLVEQANLELQKQHYDKAEALLKNALEKQPEHAIANFNYGVLHYQQKNFQDAIRSFQRALAQVKRQDDDLSQQARNKLSAQCHQAIAKASYQLAQQEQPTENTTTEQQLQNRIEQAKNAVDHFQQALKLDAHAPNGKNHLNAAKYAQKKLEQIKRELKQQQQQQDGNGDKQEGEDKNKDDKQQNDKQQGDNQQQNDKQQNDKQQNDKQQGENQQQNDKQQGENQQQNEREQQKKDLENLEQQQRQAAQDMNNSQKSQQELNQQQQQLQQQLKEQLDKQQQSQEKNQKAEDYLKQAQAKQQEASQQLQKQDKEKAQQAQKDAADMTRMARHALDNPEPQQQPKQPEQQPEQHQDEQQPEQKKEQAQQQSDARAIDAINQENIDKKNRMKRYFAPPARQSRDW